jgi:alpha-amylase
MLSNLLGNKNTNLKKFFATVFLLVLFTTSCNYQNLEASAEEKVEYTIDLTGSSTVDTNSLDVSAAENVSEGAILQAFCWSFDSIKENMADIAEAGFTSIQTSPINEVDSSYPTMKLMGSDESGGTNGAWWWHYQPTDWKIGNYQLGTRDEFIAMCDEADKYNIKILVDVAPNHTASDLTKVSQGLNNSCGGNLYHDTGFTAITNWSDRLQCTRYSMINLPDVNTEHGGFQDYFIAYLNDCIACGADGFRYDTAKHIGLPDDDRPSGVTNNFWTRVTSEITDASRIFNYGEVLQGGNERISEYINVIGSATASNYGSTIRSAINSNNLSKANILSYQVGNVDTSDIVTWVESHDNYINDGTWQQLDDTEIKLAWAVITAREDGAPLFFDRPYESSTSNKWGSNTIGIAGSDLYKDDEISAVNKFKNAMVGESECLYNPNSNTQVLMIERGTKGVVLINSSSSAVTISNTTNLAESTYTSITDDKSEYAVANGYLTGTIPARSVSVLMTGNDGPEVYIDNYESSFTTDTIDIVLRSKNTTNATYQMNDEPSYLYSDGDVITIGDGDAYNTVYHIALAGIDSNGETISKEYTITKKEPGLGTTIYFEKPSSWGDSINAYVYDESGSSLKEIASWPGKVMENEGDGLYSYTFEEEYDVPFIIFNDGSNQTPNSGEQGFAVINGGTYNINGLIESGSNEVTVYYYTSWSPANIHYQIGSGDWTSVPGIPMSSSDVNGYKVITIDLGEASTLTACFNNGSGSWDNNNGNNYYFGEPGTYSLKEGTISNGTP